MSRLKEENITDRWSTLIEGAQGSGQRVFDEVKKRIEELEPPNLHIIEQNVTMGGALNKRKRVYLTVKHKRIKGFYMYIGAMDYGKQLFISWYLIQEPTGLMKFLKLMTSHWAAALVLSPVVLFGRAIEKIQKEISPINLNIFDSEELTAYVTTGRHAVLDSVERITGELDQDFSKVDTKSRGFLNIS